MVNLILVLVTILSVFNFITWFFNRDKIKLHLAEEKKEWEEWMKELKNTPIKHYKHPEPKSVFNWTEIPPMPNDWNTSEPEALPVPDEYWESLTKSDRQTQKYFIGHDPIAPAPEVIRKVFAVEPELIEEMATPLVAQVLNDEVLEILLENVRPGNLINILKSLDIAEDKPYFQKSSGFNWDYEIEFYLKGKTYLLEGDGFSQNNCKFSIKS